MALRRLPGWTAAFSRYIQQAMAVPFDFGQNDCATFAAGDVLAITGQDVRPVIWSDKRTAARALKKLGSLAEAVDLALPRLASPAFAWRGDIVLVAADAMGSDGPCLAVADADRWWAPSANGLASGPVSACLMAWGVGHA